jgi:hypothetical protein
MYNSRGLTIGAAMKAHVVSEYTDFSNSVRAANLRSVVQEYINSGNDIITHSFSHGDLSTNERFDIDGPADSCFSVSVDDSNSDPENWTGTITLKENCSGTPNEASLTIDLAYDDGQSVSEVMAWINADADGSLSAGAWTCDWKSSINQLGGWMPAVALGDYTDEPCGTQTDLSYDRERQLNLEMKYAKGVIEEYIREGAAPGSRAATYESKYFIAGGNLLSEDDARDYLETAGFLMARGDQSYSDGSRGDDGYVDSINPYRLRWIYDETFRNASAYFEDNVTFDAATKTITIEDYNVITSQYWMPDLLGENLLVYETENNNGVYTLDGDITIGNYDGDGDDDDTQITVNETLVDEVDVRAWVGTKNEYMINIHAIMNHCDLNQDVVEIYTHFPGEVGGVTGLTEHEHAWFAEVLSQDPSIHYGVNEFADLVWSGNNERYGVAWTAKSDCGGGAEVCTGHDRRFLSVLPEIEWSPAIYSDSPCINAGTEAATVGLSGTQTDSSGNSVNIGPRYNVDIGVYPFDSKRTPSILGGTLVGN